ncbi:hypothetical protein ES703_98873 [subsurface metagenome]
MAYPIPSAKLVKQGITGNTCLCLQRTPGIINAGMDDLAIPAAGFFAKGLVLLQYVNFPVLACYLSSHGQPYHSGSDYRYHDSR